MRYGQTLSNHDWFELHLHRLLGSRLVSHAIAAGRREDIGTALILWAESVRQDPAGTLPDDDVELAAMARYGSDLDGWRRARKWAMHGWRPVLIPEALEAGKADERRLGHPFMEPIIARMHRRASSRAQGRDASRLAVQRSRVKKKLEDMRHKRLADQPSVVASVTEWLDAGGLYITQDNIIIALEQLGVPKIVARIGSPET